MRKSLNIVMLVVGLASSFALSTCIADDVFPPHYRGGPLSVEAHWDFNTLPNFASGEAPDSFTAIGGSQGETLYNGFQTHIDFSPNDWMWDGNSGITPVNPNGGTFAINAQNWVDDEPLKLLRVQMTYSGIAPDVFFGIGEELAGTPGAFDVLGMEVGMFDDGRNYYEDWTFAPNPDWEQMQVFVSFGTTIDQVDFDSISIPEPASACLFGLAGWFAVIRRKRD